MTRVLVLSLDSVGEKMSGVAIRAYETARALQRAGADVAIAAARGDADPSGLQVPVLRYERHDGRSLARHLHGVDVVIGQPQWPRALRALRRSGARLIFDVTAPEPLETLEFAVDERPLVRRALLQYTTDRTVDALRCGHHLLCASERQRDLWIGSLVAERLLSPAGYDADPSLGDRMLVVPFGLQDEPAVRTPAGGIRERFPQIGPDDPIVLWNSAIYRWFDAPTAIRAIGHLAERRPDVRLVFMGASARRAEDRATAEAHAVADELGLRDRNVFFNDAWVPYGDRINWLLDADCSIACHERHLETRFAFRTRALDCFWSGLPLVTTGGDILADLVATEDLGAVVPVGDPVAVAAALDGVLARGRQTFAPRLAAMAARHRWSVVTEPLVAAATAPSAPAPLGPVAVRRPAQLARTGAYMGARGVLDLAGVDGFPRGRLRARTGPGST